MWKEAVAHIHMGSNWLEVKMGRCQGREAIRAGKHVPVVQQRKHVADDIVSDCSVNMNQLWQICTCSQWVEGVYT